MRVTIFLLEPGAIFARDPVPSHRAVIGNPMKSRYCDDPRRENSSPISIAIRSVRHSVVRDERIRARNNNDDDALRSSSRAKFDEIIGRVENYTPRERARFTTIPCQVPCRP